MNYNSDMRNADDYLDKKYYQALLFDFYGELLKENNREIYEDYILNDLSLGEIALDKGISRQGIHDAIKRTDKRLKEYENKIHLLDRYLAIQNKVDKIQGIIDEIKDSKNLDDINSKKLSEMEYILKEILKET